MDNSAKSQARKQGRYDRLKAQLAGLLPKCELRDARMCTAIALLHHKMDGFFWTGFYLLQSERLIVRMYQGPVACMELRRGAGVCWAAIESGTTIVVPDVAAFPGHVACDSRSKSEIVVPFRDSDGRLLGVLDIDSDRLDNFDEVDARNLEEILRMIIVPA